MDSVIVVFGGYVLGLLTFLVCHKIHWGYWTINPFDDPELFEEKDGEYRGSDDG